MTRTIKVIENTLDAAIRIILLENDQNHRKIRTKELLLEALGAIAVKKMMRRKVKESLNVTFDEIPSPSKTSPWWDDDLLKKNQLGHSKKNLENDIVDETLEIDEIVNIKESRNHPLESVIGNLNQRTLRLVAQGYNQQEGIDYDETYAPVARLESIRILLAYACALDFKLFQMDAKSAFLNGFIIEEKQTALAIFTTEAEYVSVKKACQQALWMKQALIDYNKGHISIEKVPSVDNIVDILTKPLKREMTLEDELRYTKSYVPTISNENYIPDILKPIIRNLECRSIHEGRPISPESNKYDNIQTLFQVIKLSKIYELHEEICPRFLLEFYSSMEITKDDNLNIFLTFWALKRTFKFSLELFASILSIPYEGECSYSEEPSLDSLKTNQE
ncbi:retrovirus-related pol polyprotein from transposon TNT 1-94 [Tanacetum coccineum]